MESPVERALLRASSLQPMPRPHLRHVPPGGDVVFSAGATERPAVARPAPRAWIRWAPTTRSLALVPKMRQQSQKPSVSYGLPVDHPGFPALEIDRAVNIDAHQR